MLSKAGNLSCYLRVRGQSKEQEQNMQKINKPSNMVDSVSI